MTDDKVLDALFLFYTSIKDELVAYECTFIYGILAILIGLGTSAVLFYFSEEGKRSYIRQRFASLKGQILMVSLVTLAGILLGSFCVACVRLGYRKLQIEAEIVKYLPKLGDNVVLPEHSVFNYGMSSLPLPIRFSNRLLYPDLHASGLNHESAPMLLIVVTCFSIADFIVVLWGFQIRAGRTRRRRIHVLGTYVGSLFIASLCWSIQVICLTCLY